MKNHSWILRVERGGDGRKKGCGGLDGLEQDWEVRKGEDEHVV